MKINRPGVRAHSPHDFVQGHWGAASERQSRTRSLDADDDLAAMFAEIAAETADLSAAYIEPIDAPLRPKRRGRPIATPA